MINLNIDLDGLFDTNISYFFRAAEGYPGFYCRVLFSDKDKFKEVFENAKLRWMKEDRLWLVIGVVEQDLRDFGMVEVNEVIENI